MMELKDKEIKNNLEQRKITPSPALWEKMEGELNKKRFKKSKRFLKLGIAASFILGLFLSYMWKTHDTREVKIAYSQERIDTLKPNPVQNKRHQRPTMALESTPNLSVNKVSKYNDARAKTHNEKSYPVPNKTILSHDVDNSIHVTSNESIDNISPLNNPTHQFADNETKSNLDTEVNQLLTKALNNSSEKQSSSSSKNMGAQLLRQSEQEIAYNKNRTIIERTIDYSQKNINQSLKLLAKNTPFKN